jgi:hypothetical protein
MLKNPAFIIDQRLTEELQNPGSDQRWGVNLIVRPPPKLIKQIAAVQGNLRTKEPEQYYYPSYDLPLTFLEICSGMEPLEAQSIVFNLRPHLPALFQGIAIPMIKSLVLRWDQRACVLSSVEIKTINEARQKLGYRR